MECRVLISVLDWGLGHATRSVPIIEALVRRGIPTWMAGSGQSLAYLRARFPECPALTMPERSVQYHRHGAIPALAKRVLVQARINGMQRDFIRDAVHKHSITHLISDNVYGGFAPGIPSAIITHQLAPPAPVLSGAVHRQIAAWLRRFDRVWVPDVPGGHSLAGKLASNKFFDGEIRHLGRVSRFERGREAIKNIALTALLSGPEPQRSILESKIVEAAQGIPGRKVIIRGLRESEPRDYGEDFHVLPFADGMELANILRRTQVVVCRSGFSSLSDLMALGVKACVVPTPGQGEQLYLAERVASNRWFACARQNALTADSIRSAENFSPPTKEPSHLEAVLDAFLSEGRSGSKLPR